MPDTTSIQISSITVLRDERQRREIDSTDLQSSIRQHGLINPIVVRQDGVNLVLVTGERRLDACTKLGWTEIPARFFSDLSPHEAQIIELEENIKRKDLTWQEFVTAAHRIHSLCLSQDSSWTMGETASSLSISLPYFSMLLEIFPHLSDERISSATSSREAYNVIKRRAAREQAGVLEEILFAPQVEETESSIESPVFVGPTIASYKPPTLLRPSVEETIRIASFLDFAPSYAGPLFNLIHCDFPYGINPFAGPQGRGANPTYYEDTEDIYFELLHFFCENLTKFTSLSTHILFWYSERYKEKTLEIFNEKAPQVSFSQHPLIWLKSDNAGISPDSRHLPRHIYETCLFGSIGQRQLVKVKADAYQAPTDQRLHPSTKPEPVLRHFFSMVCDEFTSLFDPTCGSGSSIRAAESLGAKLTLGLEINEEFADGARKALKLARFTGS